MRGMSKPSAGIPMLMKAMGVDLSQIEDQAKQFVMVIVESLQRIEAKQNEILQRLKELEDGRSSESGNGTGASGSGFAQSDNQNGSATRTSE
jgi:type II secretory pathway predicted ATPase ExeA